MPDFRPTEKKLKQELGITQEQITQEQGITRAPVSSTPKINLPTVLSPLESFQKIEAILGTTYEVDDLVLFVFDKCTNWPNFTKIIIKDKKSYVGAGLILGLHPEAVEWLIWTDEQLREPAFTPREKITTARVWINKIIDETKQKETKNAKR